MKIQKKNLGGGGLGWGGGQDGCERRIEAFVKIQKKKKLGGGGGGEGSALGGGEGWMRSGGEGGGRGGGVSGWGGGGGVRMDVNEELKFL